MKLQTCDNLTLMKHSVHKVNIELNFFGLNVCLLIYCLYIRKKYIIGHIYNIKVCTFGGLKVYGLF